ncbi:nocturnin isoform X1 [Dipodomys spectabilis]|uniref:nocturnin isoform X1 n=1 Tax=Dipodomys spectabilis TaxID=105255 RepID=UPI001C5467D8|nr:nocturnin isoform X1 [Dipodomys spectabilis]
MYQSPRRLCSALLRRDGAGLRRLPGPGLPGPGPRRQAPPPPAPRLLTAAPGAARPRSPTASPMGHGTSRLYSALAKTLTSGAAAPHPEYLLSPDPEHLEPIDPKELLEECRAVLHTRPPRFQRDFVSVSSVSSECPSSHPPIRVMQWNILAQALGEGKDNFVQCPAEALRWEERKCLILEEILAYQPDILCLQEVDHYFDTFQPLLSRLGYQCTFLPKPWSPCLDVEHNNGPDGCALFFLQNRFKLINSANIRLTAMTLKTNQVAIAQTLECRESGRQLCVAVTHLKARTGWERFRSAQGCDLLQNLQSITQGARTPLIVCGDFNAEPTEEVYRHFASSSLNLSSAYKLLSADGQSEPPYTTWKIRTSGECRHTLDYIWYSQHALSVRSALDLLTEEQIGPNRLPSFNYPSDHLSLVCDFSFKEPPHGLL